MYTRLLCVSNIQLITSCAEKVTSRLLLFFCYVYIRYTHHPTASLCLSLRARCIVMKTNMLCVDALGQHYILPGIGIPAHRRVQKRTPKRQRANNICRYCQTRTHAPQYCGAERIARACATKHNARSGAHALALWARKHTLTRLCARPCGKRDSDDEWRWFAGHNSISIGRPLRLICERLLHKSAFDGDH